MITTLAQALEFQDHSEMPSEQILGPSADDFATFWDNNQNAFKIAKDVLIADYCRSQTFDSDGLRNYRLGLNAFFTLFEQASIDRIQKIQLETRDK